MAVFTQTINLVDKVTPKAKAAGDAIDSLIAKVKTLSESLKGLPGLPSLGSGGAGRAAGGGLAGKARAPKEPAQFGPVFDPRRQANDQAKKEKLESKAQAKLASDADKASRIESKAQAKLASQSVKANSENERLQAKEKSKVEKLESKSQAKLASVAGKSQKAKLSDEKNALAEAGKLRDRAVADDAARSAKLTAMATIGRDVIAGVTSGIGNALKSVAAGDAGGVVGGLTESLAGAAKLLDMVVPGLGQAASMLITIAGGFASMTVGLIQAGAAFAIESAQSKQQMVSMLGALGQGVISGDQFDEMLTDMSSKLGVTKDAMVPMVRELAAMGITGEDSIRKMTTAALSAKALAGGAESGAQAFMSLAKKIQIASETGQGLKIPAKGLGSLAEMGLNVNDIAGKMGLSAKVLASQLKAGTVNASKFGDALQTALVEKGAGPLSTMSNSMGNLKDMLKQSIGDVFEDIEIGPFIAQVKSLFAVFATGTPAGEALKSGIGGFFNKVFKVLADGVPLVKHFFLDMIILGLKAYIALTPMAAKLDEFFISLGGASALTSVFNGLVTVVKVLATMALVAFSPLIALVTVGSAMLVLGGILLNFFGQAMGAVFEFAASAATAAKNFILGLVGGIINGGSMVVDSVKSLASQATNAFKSALGIASPSKVMFAMGGHVAQGAADGIEDNSDSVGGASRGLASAAVGGFTGAPTTSGQSSKSSGATINVSVQIDGAGRSAMEITELMVSSVFERMALGSGI